MAENRLKVPISALTTLRWRGQKILSTGLATLIVLAILAMVFVPWQQSVSGNGRVVAYAPLERQQTIEAPIDGRVTHWYVQEGTRVQAGEAIADIADNDPDILARMRREQDAAQTQVTATSLSIVLEEARITSLQSAYESDVAHAELKITMALERESAAGRAVDAAQSAMRTSTLNIERQRHLHSKGLASKRELEMAELDYDNVKAGLARAEASLRSAQAETKAFRAERNKTVAHNQASLESARSSLEKLRGEKAKAESELAKVETRLARQERMQVVAPRAGVILRLIANQGTEMVKAGDPLVVLVPDVDSNAVELLIRGNDAALVAKDRKVRLQFEGWPAVQFIGWPSAAIGTFGGTIAFVDAHGDAQGNFRVVVVPDADDHPWPNATYLRQGVRANGWILLDQVKLGFEIWRQFNGFPATVEAPKTSDKGAEKGSK
jgi:multidrug resistance efflux pump